MNNEATVNLDGIREMLQRARDAGTKWPKIRLVAAEGRRIVLSLSGDKARYPGSVNITDGRPYGSNTWYGRIVAGRLRGGSGAFPGLYKVLADFITDPERAAGAFVEAQRGRCCFCGRKVKKGAYGPDCANKYGLPYTK
tara:strand:+ start:532 stop:948 length:417 start_codon:yes stop_codon:yes gene_type:complete